MSKDTRKKSCELLRDKIHEEIFNVEDLKQDLSKGKALTLLKEIEKSLIEIIYTPQECGIYKEYKKTVEYNEKKIIAYDTECQKIFNKIRNVVNASFVDEFNETFYTNFNKVLMIPDEFEPATIMKKGCIKKDWLVMFLNNIIYDLFQNGLNVRIDKIEDKWIEVRDEDNHFLRKDKFYGVFLLDYKMEMMFPDSDGFKNCCRFTRLRIKLNSPKSEWKIIV